MHHLVLQMGQQANGAYVQFPIDDFMHIAKASRVNPDEMAKGVAALKNGIVKVSCHLCCELSFHFFRAPEFTFGVKKCLLVLTLSMHLSHID